MELLKYFKVMHDDIVCVTCSFKHSVILRGGSFEKVDRWEKTKYFTQGVTTHDARFTKGLDIRLISGYYL